MHYALENTYLVLLEAATPKKTRKTSASWKLIRKGPGIYAFVNSAETRNRKYAIVQLLEEGTKPHIIRVRKAGALHWKKKGKDFFALKVLHPGFEGRQFVRRTLEDESNMARYKKVFEIALRNEIARIKWLG